MAIAGDGPLPGGDDNSPLYLAVDQGTHSTRALAFDAHGRVVARGEREIALSRPQTDWAEQDAEEVVASVHAAIAQMSAGLPPRARRFAAAGLSSQRASCVCWDPHTGAALSPVFSWQDRRTHAWIDTLQAHGDDVHRRTGLFLSPHYGASKLRWAFDNLPRVAQAHAGGRLAWGPLASFLAFRLVKERPMLADPQCAARTQLWNLHTRDWDPELLRLFGLPPGDCLPASALTCQDWGTLASGGIEAPLHAVNGDQSAAVFAFGWPERDSAYVNIGTSAFVQRALMAAPGHVPRQLTGIILADASTTVYMVEGNVNGAGAGLEWLSARLGIDDLPQRLPEWLQRPAPDLVFLNGVAGLGGPFWRAQFASRFVGDAAEPWQLGVALVESIAFLLKANVDHMAPYVPPMTRIRVGGGVSQLDGLCQRLAALHGMPVHRRDDPEASARGIAFLAAGRPAQWESGAREDIFAPQVDAGLRDRYRRWRALMAQATGV